MPDAPTISVTVVVVNFNGAAFVGGCLESLRGQSVPGVQVEVLVVDNGSTDGSAELIESEFAECRLLRAGRNLGFAGGVDVAIRESGGDFVVLINNDARADPGFLSAILAPFRDGSGGPVESSGSARPGGSGGSTGSAGSSGSAGSDRLAAVTGRIVLTGRFLPAPADPDAYVCADGSRWKRVSGDSGAGVELLNSTGSQLSRSGNARDRSWLEPVDAVVPRADVFGFCGGAAALRRTALDEVGLFDESLFMYYEDVDLSWRLRRSGWQVRYAHDAVVRHQHAASSGISSPFFLTHNIRNRVLVTARNGPPDMLARAVTRAFGHWLKTLRRMMSPRSTPIARRELAASTKALAQVARMLPAALAAGRRQDRTAPLPRRFVDPWLLPD